MNRYSYSNQVETSLSIDLGSDGLKIYGTLRGDISMPVVVFVHGRPGSGNDLLPFLLAHNLYELGFASLRLDMYNFMPDSRNLMQSTLETNASDLKIVVQELRQMGAKKIFMVGHSYGGLAILKAALEIDGAVLWDPTHGSVYSMKTDISAYGKFTQKRVDDLVVTTSGYGLVEAVAMKEADDRLGDTSKLASGATYPLKIISAEKGIMTQLHKRYINRASDPKQHVVIKNAMHQFTNSDDVISQLLFETSSWLEKYR